jgi:hypothetical protein
MCSAAVDGTGTCERDETPTSRPAAAVGRTMASAALLRAPLRVVAPMLLLLLPPPLLLPPLLLLLLKQRAAGGGGGSACRHSALERKPCCAPPHPARAKHVPPGLTAAARPERGVCNRWRAVCHTFSRGS